MNDILRAARDGATEAAASLAAPRHQGEQPWYAAPETIAAAIRHGVGCGRWAAENWSYLPQAWRGRDRWEAVLSHAAGSAAAAVMDERKMQVWWLEWAATAVAGERYDYQRPAEAAGRERVAATLAARGLRLDEDGRTAVPA